MLNSLAILIFVAFFGIHLSPYCCAIYGQDSFMWASMKELPLSPIVYSTEFYLRISMALTTFCLYLGCVAALHLIVSCRIFWRVVVGKIGTIRFVEER